jgi:hypothetical protein
MANPNMLRKIPTFNPRAATPAAMAQVEPQTVTVKATVDTITNPDGSTRESPRVVYDSNDMPIPHDAFATVMLTADLTIAILAGDLEEADSGTGDEGEGTPAVVKEGARLPADFGGQPTAEEAQAKRDRIEAAEQARKDRLEQGVGQAGQRQEPRGPDAQSPNIAQRATQDRQTETREQERSSRS